MNFFKQLSDYVSGTKETNINSKNIKKEGYLLKESRHTKKWRA